MKLYKNVWLAYPSLYKSQSEQLISMFTSIGSEYYINDVGEIERIFDELLKEILR